MFYNYLIFSMVALSLCILKKHFVSLWGNLDCVLPGIFIFLAVHILPDAGNIVYLVLPLVPV